MKKVFIAAGLGLAMLTACGGATTPCDCGKAIGQMMKDYAEADGDEAKMKSLEKKYEKLNEECGALADEMGQEEFNKAAQECMN